MSSESSVSFQSEVTRTSSSVVDVKSPTSSNAEAAQRTVSCAEGESGHLSTNDMQSRVMMRMTAPHSFSTSLVTTFHVDEPPGMELVTGASEVVTSSIQCPADGLSQMNSTSQRHVECPGCAARRVVYHTCNLQSHDQLAFNEYPLSPGSLAPEFSLTSLQEGGEGTLTYSAQAPVSATHIQHSHGAVPFGSHQVGSVRTQQCQHDRTHCTLAPEKPSEVDPYYTAYGEQLGTTGSQRFVSGSEVPRPCPVHGSETFVTSFNPTFDIPLYSNIPGHPYLPHYYVQPPHRHLVPRRPLPTHLPGAPYAPFHTGGHHHCCSTLFHDGTTEVRRQFPGHYEPPASVIPDDHFHPNISTGTLASQSHTCPLHGEHEDLQLVTAHHSMASPEGNSPQDFSRAEPRSGSVAEAGTPGDFQPEESQTENVSFGSTYRVREPEMFVVSTDVTSDVEEPSVLSAVASDVPVMRKRKSESFVCDLDGSSVDGSLLSSSLASHLKSYSTDVVRSHTPPERDTNSKRDVEAPVADASKAEDGHTLPNDAPNVRGMAFTIDFGNDLDSPEITEHWKQFTPYRIHAGIQERASKTKSRLKEKSESLEGEQQKKETGNFSGGGGRRSTGTKIRSRSPGSRSVGGYISDGHASGISSDNEDASICSEMIGCIQGRRKLNRVADPRSFLTSGPLPSKSQPSLVKAKPSSDRVIQNVRSAPSGGVVRGSVLSKSARTTPSRDQTMSKTGTKKAADAKPSLEKASSTKSEPPKRVVRSAKTVSEGTPAPRRLPKRPCDDNEAGGKKDDEIIDVTSYLINRMLFPSEKTSNGFKTKSRPAAVRDLRTGSPSSAPLQRATSSKRKPQDENIPDNVSETGTYTIEDDPQMSEVQKARDEIGVVFGVKESKPDRLVRPVIEGAVKADPEPGGGHHDVTMDHAVGEEDVFEYEPDRSLQDDYKLQVSEAVSSAISATKAIQKALLQKTSRSRTSSGGVGSDGKATEVATESSESYPSNIKSVNQISSSEPPSTDDSGRQCAIDVYDEGDFGTFAISFDAPSPKPRDSSCLSQEDQPSSMQEMTARPDNGSSPAAEADHSEDQQHDDRLKYASDVQMLMQTVDATVQELHVQMCKRSAHLKSSGGTVQRPSREATFVKEIPPKDASSSSSTRVASQPRSSTFKPPSSTSGRRNRDCDTSDAGSESETASLSSMDYSTMSSRFTRASILRSSTGKGPLPAPRVNRTFALRCSKASGSESDSTAALVPRSRSAGNDNRLALRDAASRSTSRSRSRPRNISPASDVSHGRRSEVTNSQRNPARRRDLEQQHSEDSSASICSSISSRSSSTFMRKDGGRYSMRTEKSSLGPIPLNTSRTKDKKLSKPKSAGSQSSRDRPGSGGSTSSQRQMTTAQAKELNAWRRRKQYDPRKAVADAKAKGGAHGISKHGNGSQSEPEDGADVDDGSSAFDRGPRRPTEESERASEIAQLSNAVAYNLNVLAESTRKDSVNPDELRLQKLPVFSCDSNTRSAFSALHISGSHKARSIPLVSSSDHNTSFEESEKSTYDNVLVNSIQQVSRKVKVLTDQLITKVRDEKRRGGSAEGPMISPLGSGTIPTWEHASPELTSILENLKRTEQHLQVVHKALFSGNAKGRGGPEAQQRHQTVERQRVLAERGGFRPIEKPASATAVRKRSTSRKQTSLSANPLSGDEYY